jgi:hypothetical protein
VVELRMSKSNRLSKRGREVVIERDVKAVRLEERCKGTLIKFLDFLRMPWYRI